MKQATLRKALDAYLRSVKERNPRFSLRSFCKKIQVNSGCLSLFLNAKRELSSDVYLRVTNAICKDEWEKQRLIIEYNLENFIGLAPESLVLKFVNVKDMSTDKQQTILEKLGEEFQKGQAVNEFSHLVCIAVIGTNEQSALKIS